MPKKFDPIEAATVPDPSIPRTSIPEPPVTPLEAGKLQEPKVSEEIPGKLPTSKGVYVPKTFKVVGGTQMLNQNTGQLGYAIQVRGHRHTFANDSVISEMGYDIKALKKQGLKLEEYSTE